ncbi:DoxX family membrane protein [Erythrobacter sp. Alg231-14]|uniref:DoxX family membrane protein n=1 Tax=Erythrobacter sp. Alg231-14 TaxID=1922225 RepID=UPI000D54E592
MNTTQISSPQQDATALVGRLLLAALFVLAGINKIGAAEGMTGYIASAGLPAPELIFYATVALEIGGGLLLAVGLKARYAAAALGLFSIAAAVLFHNNFAEQAEITSFLKNFAIGGGMFMVAAFGPGRYSIDRG